ncbi:MAG: helix-turn-helix domain-containing protein [Pantoea sp.]|uniref:helix-turn-helix domain-containing protein n=1 Tax=Pantoea sp. TaxID=69393 RepID=UPI0039E611BD
MTLMAQAMKLRTGNPLRKLVLIKLADNASDQGECWPSISHIAYECEISERSVQNHIQYLAEKNFLWIEFRKANSGLNKSNVYHLTLNKAIEQSGAGAAPSTGAGDSPGGAGYTPPHGAGAAPRTSHSFEPIKEPIEQVADAPAVVKDISSEYAFSGEVIRLNHDHYQKWKSLYQNIDLDYELQRLDIEFTNAKPGNWFITASQKLNYQNKQSNGRPSQQQNGEPPQHWNSRKSWEEKFI